MEMIPAAAYDAAVFFCLVRIGQQQALFIANILLCMHNFWEFPNFGSKKLVSWI
jgi:hypothetical protein